MKFIEIPYGVTEAESSNIDTYGIPYFSRNSYVALPTNTDTIEDVALLDLFPDGIKDHYGSIPAFRSIAVFTDEPNDNLEYYNKDGTVLYYLGVDKLYFDIDTQDLMESQFNTRRLIKWFNSIGIFKYRIFFSGSKGFHISMDLEDVYGSYTLLPSETIKELISVYVSKLSGVILDTSIYFNRSIIRLPNTLNIKTRFYKIEITQEELFDELCNIEELAMQPREALPPIAYTNSDYTFLKNMIVMAGDIVQHNLSIRESMIVSVDGEIEPIDFIEDFIEQRQLKPGKRHEVSLTLATYFKALGMSNTEAERRLTEFMSNAKGSSTPVQQRVRESRNDIKTCYGRHIRFSKLRAQEVLS